MGDLFEKLKTEPAAGLNTNDKIESDSSLPQTKIKSHKKDKKSSKRKHKHKKDHKHKRSKKSKDNNEDDADFAIPLELMNKKSHLPETPEEFKRRSSAMRREVDPVTGRTRLIRGDNEILEEIVSKERHVNINKAATEGDGRYFQEKTIGKKNVHKDYV